MSRDDAYRAASARADERKTAFLSSARAAKARIAPARLKQDVKDKAIETLLDGTAYAAAKVRQRPTATAAAVAAFGLYLMRRPLGALFRRLYVRIGDSTDETPETEDG